MQQEPKQPLKLMNLKIIWFALLATHFLYALRLFMRPVQEYFPAERVNPQLIPILSSLAIVVMIVAIFIPRFRFNKEKKKFLEVVGPDELRSIKLEILISVFANPFILRHSLFQTVALFGFFLGMTQNNINLFYPFALVSIVAYVINFPTEEKIRAAFI